MDRLLPDWLNAYMKYTDNSEPPYTYKLWTGLSIIAACLRRKCVLNYGTLTFYPNLYVVLVGPSGKCRKGTAMRPGTKFLREKGIKIASESITREALIRELKQSSESHIDNMNRMHLHSSLTVFSEELTVFLGYNNQQLMADLCNWYDCGDTWTYRTKNMGTDDITGVWVNLMGATTPDLLQTTLPRDAIGGGLTSRIIFVYEFKKGKIVPDPFLSEGDKELERQLLVDLDRICLLTGEFKMTPGYLESWMEWYVSQNSRKGGVFDDYKFSGYVERRPTHAMKLAMLSCASRTNSMVIDTEDFKRAIQILELTEMKMIHTFSGVGRLDTSDIMQRIMSWLAYGGDVSFGTLLSAFYQDVTKKELTDIVEALQTMDFIQTEMKAGGEILLKVIDKNGLFKQ